MSQEINKGLIVLRSAAIYYGERAPEAFETVATEIDRLRAEVERLRADGSAFACRVMVEATVGIADAAIVQDRTYTMDDSLAAVRHLAAELEQLRGEREEAEIRLADLAGAGRELLAARWVRAWEECADYLDKMIGEPVPHGYRSLAEFAAREASRRLAEEKK